MEGLDVNNLQKLRVVDLKEHLIKRGLSTSGLKADLVKRLREAVQNEVRNSGENNDQNYAATGADVNVSELQPTYLQVQSNLSPEKKMDVDSDGELEKVSEVTEAEPKFQTKEQENQNIVTSELHKRQMGHNLDEAKDISTEQCKRVNEEQRKLSENEGLKLAEIENKKSEDERRKHITTSAAVVTSVIQTSLLPPQPLVNRTQFGHLTPSSQSSSVGSIQMPPPPPPPSLSSINILPPPPTVLMSSVSPRPPVSSSQINSQFSTTAQQLSVQNAPSVVTGSQVPRFSQPPPPPPSVVLSGSMVIKQTPLPPPPPPLSVGLNSNMNMTKPVLPPPPPPSIGLSSSITQTVPPLPPSIGLSSSIKQTVPPPPVGLSSNIAQTVLPPPPPIGISSNKTQTPPLPPSVGLSSSISQTPLPPPPQNVGLSSGITQPAPPSVGLNTSTSVTKAVPQPSSVDLSSSITVTQTMSAPVSTSSNTSVTTPVSKESVSVPISKDETSVKSTTLSTTSASETINASSLDQSTEIQLPQALEKVLALKTERAQQLGVDPDIVIQASMEEKEHPSVSQAGPVALVSVDEADEEEYMEEDISNRTKESKNRRRKKKKKQRAPKINKERRHETRRLNDISKEKSVDIDIEYVQDVLDVSDPLYNQFIRVFEKFKLSEPEKNKVSEVAVDTSKEEIKQEAANKIINRKKPADLDDDDEKDDQNKDEEKPKLSKRKLKRLSRMSVAELKQKVNRPELVEMHDVTAKDPVLLLHLKASRNTVPVPRHWCFKRKYLQGKRGIEKPAFELPDFIKRTGIMEMRQALQEKEDQKTMKAKMRERVRPKLGKIDIDYQKLHDAFFKWQTKPRMTIHGDLYYEGKEFETRLKEKKPGDLSDDLRIALGMPTGPNAQKCPPPWLIAMQRYGPPPSYPNLKIPGLNAPIPEGCSFGYHAGGWGKPPVDEHGRPLYGDVFGTQMAENQPHIPEEEIDHTLWGELESESSEEEEDEDEEEEEEEEAKGEDETGLVTPAEGLITPSGFSSIPAGMETPDMIELRKRKIEAEMEGGETPALYTILPEKKAERVGASMMGSTHIYDLAAAIPASKVKTPGTASVPPQGIEVTLDPSELELDEAAMHARFEQTVREQQSQLEKEDLSDMVAEHAARQKTKRKKQQQDSGKAPKKYKEFKF